LGWDLDADYLNSLSVDAVPALLMAYQTADLSPTDQNEIGAILACRRVTLAARWNEQPWQSFHFAEGRALRLLHGVPEFEGVQLYQTDYGSWRVLVNDIDRPCYYDY
jgi:hypothetical protein